MKGAFEVSKKKIRLTIFEERFGRGGIETFIINLCNHIDLNKFNVNVVVVNKVTSYYDAFFHAKGIRV